eukprot:355359-Chlamydomonas_euryale.AAC.22
MGLPASSCVGWRCEGGQVDVHTHGIVCVGSDPRMELHWGAVPAAAGMQGGPPLKAGTVASADMQCGT